MNEPRPARAVGTIGWRIVDGTMLALFVLSVVVQVNDPDPLAWMLIYAAAALATLHAFMGRPRFPLPVLIGAIALIAAGQIAPRVLGRVRFAEMFAAWEMQDLRIEEAREMYGLILIAIWMLILALRARMARLAADPSAQRP